LGVRTAGNNGYVLGGHGDHIAAIDIAGPEGGVLTATLVTVLTNGFHQATNNKPWQMPTPYHKATNNKQRQMQRQMPTHHPLQVVTEDVLDLLRSEHQIILNGEKGVVLLWTPMDGRTMYQTKDHVWWSTI